jgi:putative transposase
MSKYRLHKGMHFELRGREYVIEGRLRNGDIQVRDVSINEFSGIPERTVINAWFEGDLKFLDDNRDTTLAQRKAAKTYIQELALLKEATPKLRFIKKEFYRRRKYVMAVMDARLSRRNKATLQPIIDSVSKTAGDGGGLDPDPPSWKTLLYRWLLPFLSCNEDFRVLIPRYKERGNNNPKFTGVVKSKGQKYSPKEKRQAEEIAETILEVKDEKLIDGQRHTMGSIIDNVCGRLAEKNAFRVDEDRLPLPHKSSVYRFLDKNLNEYEKDTLRYGKKYADQKYRENKQGILTTRPLERVEIDHTKTDILVIDTDVMLPIGRPSFTSSVDVFTKMDLGFFVSLYYPGYLAAMHCLRHSILPKTYVKDRYPSVKHDWNCYGVPEQVVLDNAPEFHDASLEEAAVQLGFIVQYGPKGEAHYRAAVERHFRTKNTEWLHRQPGTTFSSVFDRKDYDPEKNAVVSFSDFMEMAHVYMIDIYPRQLHRGLRVDKFPRHKLKDIEVVPAKLWEKAIEEYPPALPPHRDELLVLLGKLEYRCVSASGIELEGLVYNNERLSLLRRNLHAGEKVPLKLNLDDLSAIHVIDSGGGYFQVPAVNHEYTHKLTLWQHRKIKEFARQRAKDTVDIDDLIRAKHVIQEIVERGWKSIKKGGARQKMACFKDIKQEDYSANASSKSHNNLHDLQPKSSVLLLNPESTHLVGISDTRPYIPSHGTGEHADHGQSFLGNINFPPDSKKSHLKNDQGKSHKGKTKDKRKSSREVRAAEDTDTVETSAKVDSNEQVDMSGYKGNFNLPK